MRSLGSCEVVNSMFIAKSERVKVWEMQLLVFSVTCMDSEHRENASYRDTAYLLPPNQLEMPLFACAAPCRTMSANDETQR